MQLTHIVKELLAQFGNQAGPLRAEARGLLAHLETYKPAHDSKVVRFAAPQPRRRKKETK